ncbi:hypothetical protein [Microbacterium sp.]|uniref:hypothetical protein n=1 Tax=Microbacterium sp. TaxID=51671 RepID=UPI0032423FC1
MTAPNTFQLAILRGLNTTGKHVFAGIESAEDRAVRRRIDRATAAAKLPRNRDGRRARLLAQRSSLRAIARGIRRQGEPEVSEEAAA